ncbi:cell wall protein, partial [Streptomyces sp. SID89]|nr:cell wall protein [Streptomyces sp. SID89]
MSSARRTLLTATAAGTLLGALWFVPSASATGE